MREECCGGSDECKVWWVMGWMDGEEPDLYRIMVHNNRDVGSRGN